MIRLTSIMRLLLLLRIGMLMIRPAYGQVPHTFIYDPLTGNFSLDNEGPLLTSLEIKSLSGVFTGTKPPLLGELGDVFNRNKYFKLQPSGFGDFDWGPMMAPGLSVDFLSDDLTFRGSRLPDGPLGATQIVTADRRSWVLRYDAASGSVGLENAAHPMDVPSLTSIVIDSATEFFVGERPADLLNNSFDVFRPQRAFRLWIDGFTSLDWPRATATGRTEQQVADDLCIAGSFVGGGALLGVHLNRMDGPQLRTCQTSPDLGGPIDPDNSTGVVLTYYPDGRLILSTNGTRINSLEIKSPDGIFTGQRPSQLSGLFDVFNKNTLFVLNPVGMGDQDFGFVAAPGLTPEIIENIQVAGSALTHGQLADLHVVYGVIPEPTSGTLVTLGIVPLIDSIRRSRRSKVKG